MTTVDTTPPIDNSLTVEGMRIIGVPSMAFIVDDIEVTLKPGEILGLVGESGSGKTTLGLALLRYCKPGTELAAGDIVVRGHDLARLSNREVRDLRGRDIAYIPQSPASALNPALRIRTQLAECLSGDDASVLERVREVLREVALPDTDEFLARYPHQLSGGQQQRVAIAMAFTSRPGVLVLDEPTTGLDVSTQKHVLETVKDMCRTYHCAAVYITHDLAVVAELADSVAVLYSGRVVEVGPTSQVTGNPQHPYTTRLLLAVPDLDGKRPMVGIPGHAPSPLARPQGCSFSPRCPLADDRCRTEQPPRVVTENDHMAECWHAGEPVPVPVVASPASQVREDAPVVLQISNVKAGYGKKIILEDMTLHASKAECLALLGESGSGKTTLARCIAGLMPDYQGQIQLDGEVIAASSFKRTKEQRRKLQYIFQNPYESLNPRRLVSDLVLGPLAAVGRKPSNPDEVVANALELASLRPDYARRYPHQLSGGERQRVAIARALATDPEVLICDEITSALDVSVQSSLVSLLRRLQSELGLTLVFITHNIALVRNIAQRVAILEKGRIVEMGGVEDIFANPQHAYTRSLIASTPSFDAAVPEATEGLVESDGTDGAA